MIKLTKLIGIIERCSLQYRTDQFKEFGLCGAHHKYIFYVCRRPGMSQDQLAKDIHLNKSNVARSIKALEDGGFVEVRLDEADRRINRIYPTEKAYDILPFIRNKIKTWNEILLTGLTDEQKEELDKMLHIISENAIAGIEEENENDI